MSSAPPTAEPENVEPPTGVAPVATNGKGPASAPPAGGDASNGETLAALSEAVLGGTDAACDGGNGAAPVCCPYFHKAVELIGRRWTGAILEILMQGGSLRFSTIAAAVPDLSDRMLSDRLKELEAYALVERTVYPGPPVRVQYSLTPRGEELAPSLAELKRWARKWLRTPA
jgi:DNA-binding HxlR family transcriptional regulator